MEGGWPSTKLLKREYPPVRMPKQPHSWRRRVIRLFDREIRNGNAKRTWAEVCTLMTKNLFISIAQPSLQTKQEKLDNEEVNVALRDPQEGSAGRMRTPLEIFLPYQEQKSLLQVFYTFSKKLSLRLAQSGFQKLWKWKAGTAPKR